MAWGPARVVYTASAIADAIFLLFLPIRLWELRASSIRLLQAGKDSSKLSIFLILHSPRVLIDGRRLLGLLSIFYCRQT